MTRTRGGSGIQSAQQEPVLSICSQPCCLSPLSLAASVEEMVEGMERLGFAILTPCTLHTMHLGRTIVRFDGCGQASYGGLSSLKESWPRRTVPRLLRVELMGDKKSPPPQEDHRALGIGLQQGPRVHPEAPLGGVILTGSTTPQPIICR